MQLAFAYRTASTSTHFWPASWSYPWWRTFCQPGVRIAPRRTKASFAGVLWNRLGFLREKPGQRFGHRAHQGGGLLLADQLAGDQRKRGHEGCVLGLVADLAVLCLPRDPRA